MYGKRSRGISQFYLHTPPFIRRQNEPYLPLPSQLKLVLVYRPRRDGRLSWPWVYRKNVTKYREHTQRKNTDWHGHEVWMEHCSWRFQYLGENQIGRGQTGEAQLRNSQQRLRLNWEEADAVPSIDECLCFGSVPTNTYIISC